MQNRQMAGKRAGDWIKSPAGRLCLICMAAVFAWGMIAHAYAFLNPTFSHDSLMVDSAGDDSGHKLALGRVLAPAYRVVFRSHLALPWLIGVLALVWIGLAVWMIARMFRISSIPMIVLLSGICTVNITVAAMTATYIHDLDVDMFALLAAAASAYFWRRGERKSLALGALCGAAAMGLYQSYISVTIVLIMVASIMDILEGKGAGKVVVDGLKGIGMLAAAGLSYVVMLKAAQWITGVALYGESSYNSLAQATNGELSLLHRLLVVYEGFAYGLMKGAVVFTGYPMPFMAVVHVILFLGAGVVLVKMLFSRRYRLADKLLMVALGLLLPMGANIAGFLSGFVHLLMCYAFALIYLLVLLVIRHGWNEARQTHGMVKLVAGVLTGVILFGNVQASNGMYLKKELESQATLSTMTRVVEHMEAQPGYVAGETPVLFVGSSKLKRETSGFERFADITGMSHGLQISYPLTISTYFEYFLKEPLLRLDEGSEKAAELEAYAQEMPCFPDAGYVQMVDGILLVRLA